MDKLLTQKPKIIDILNSSSLSESDKESQLSLIGKTFGATYILPDLINRVESEIVRANAELKKDGSDKNFIQSVIEYHINQKQIFKQEMDKLDFELNAPKPSKENNENKG